MRRRLLAAPIVGLCAAVLPFALAAPASADVAGIPGTSGLDGVLPPLPVPPLPPTPLDALLPTGATPPIPLPAAAAPVVGAVARAAAAAPAATAIPAGLAAALAAGPEATICFVSNIGSTVLDSVLAGVPLPIAAPVGTTVPIPGVGTASVLERSENGATVRTIHVNVNAGGLVVADIVVGESTCFAAADPADATAGTPNLAG